MKHNSPVTTWSEWQSEVPNPSIIIGNRKCLNSRVWENLKESKERIKKHMQHKWQEVWKNSGCKPRQEKKKYIEKGNTVVHTVK